MIKQNRPVIFKILTQLQVIWTLQQWTQLLQHPFEWQLLRRAHIIVATGNISRFARGYSKGQPHYFGLHGINVGGLSIERKQRRSSEFGQPAMKVGFIEDSDIVARQNRRWRIADHLIVTVRAAASSRASKISHLRRFGLRRIAFQLCYPPLEFLLNK